MNLSLIVDIFPNLFGVQATSLNNEDIKLQELTIDHLQSTQPERQQEVSKFK